MKTIKTFESFNSTNIDAELYKQLMYNVLIKSINGTVRRSSGELNVDIFDKVMICSADFEDDGFLLKSKNGKYYKLNCIDINFNYDSSPELSILVNLYDDDYPADEYEDDGEMPIEDIVNLNELIEFTEQSF